MCFVSLARILVTCVDRASFSACISHGEFRILLQLMGMIPGVSNRGSFLRK